MLWKSNVKSFRSVLRAVGLWNIICDIFNAVLRLVCQLQPRVRQCKTACQIEQDCPYKYFQSTSCTNTSALIVSKVPWTYPSHWRPFTPLGTLYEQVHHVLTWAFHKLRPTPYATVTPFEASLAMFSAILALLIMPFSDLSNYQGIHAHCRYWPSLLLAPSFSTSCRLFVFLKIFVNVDL